VEGWHTESKKVYKQKYKARSGVFSPPKLMKANNCRTTEKRRQSSSCRHLMSAGPDIHNQIIIDARPHVTLPLTTSSLCNRCSNIRLSWGEMRRATQRRKTSTRGMHFSPVSITRDAKNTPAVDRQITYSAGCGAVAKIW